MVNRELIILVVVGSQNRPATAAEIRRYAMNELKHTIPFGALYTTLSRIQAFKFIAGVGEGTKRTYRLTASGKKHVIAQMEALSGSLERIKARWYRKRR